MKLTIKTGLILITVLVATILIACTKDEQSAEKFLENGKRLFEQKQYEAAKIEFNNAHRDDRKNTEALMGLAAILEVEKKWSRLEDYLLKVVDIDPQHVEARIKLANLYMASGRIDSALEQSNQLMNIAPDTTEVRVLRAAVLIKIDERGEAEKILQAEYAKDPSNVDVSVLMATMLMADKKYDDALALLNSSLESKKNNPVLNILKLDLLNRQGAFEKAIPVYKRLMDLYPESEQIPIMLAKQYFARNQQARAVEVLENFAAEQNSQVAYITAVEMVSVWQGLESAEQKLKTYIQANEELYSLRTILADMYTRSERFDEANIVLDKLIVDTAENKALNAQILTKKAQLSLLKGEVAEAKSVLQKALALDAKNVPALSMQARIMLQEGAIEDAIKALRLALRSNTDSPELLLVLAKAHEMEGQPGLANEYYTRAMAAGAHGLKETLAYAEFLVTRQQFEQAKALLKPFVDRGEVTSEALRLYAKACLTTGDWMEAEKAADMLSNAGAGTQVVSHIRGLAAMGRDDLDSAIESLEEFRNATPTSFQPVVLMVNAYLKAGEVDRALQFVDTILDNNPTNVNALYLKAAIYAHEKQWESAKMGFRKVLEQDNSHFKATEGLIRVLLTEGEYAEAERVYTEVKERLPNSVSLHLLGANLYERQHRWSEAISVYRELLGKHPDLDVVANNYAVLLQRRNQEDDLSRAIDVAKRFEDTELPHFADTLGWLYYAAGQYSKAEPLLRKAHRGLPDNSEVTYHLAANLFASGKRAESKLLLDGIQANLEQGDMGWHSEARSLLEQLEGVVH